MLVKVLRRTIQRDIAAGNTQALEAMADKLDIFLAADKLTVDEYTELVALLNEGLHPQE